MKEHRRDFRREGAARRRDALIAATLDLVAEEGISAATVRAIAARAGVTPGLIRHYFASKEELVGAAYEAHMRELTERTFADAEGGGGASARLGGLVRASLAPPVSAPRAVSLWAGFLTLVRHDPKMAVIHARGYHAFRDRLEALIGVALEEAGRPADAAERRRLAIACNAVIDGLWLEGGALPDAFRPGELARIGLASVGAIVDLELDENGGAA